ncbi:MAG TPA: branched-chain amino acid transaminase, partial [Coxiellaceae bacterium]|nr:branched-chain amino acid transaminase [Coxiellaceae bacterium]
MSLMDKKGFIWMDGEFVPWADAKVHILTHTLHYGTGVFEGLRAYHASKGTAIFRLQDHTDRLFRSAHLLNMHIPFSKEVLNEAQLEVLRVNNLKSAYIRPMVYYGAESLGLRARGMKTHAMIAAWEWGPYLGPESVDKGIRVCTSSYTRNHVNSVLSKAKANGNYMNSILALHEAQNSGFDEALLLDQSGFVAEGSAENFFLVRNGIIHTPDLTAVLEGITRDTICQLAEHLGYTIKESRITRDAVYLADEAFFTGTAAEVTP